MMFVHLEMLFCDVFLKIVEMFSLIITPWHMTSKFVGHFNLIIN